MNYSEIILLHGNLFLYNRVQKKLSEKVSITKEVEKKAFTGPKSCALVYQSIE